MIGDPKLLGCSHEKRGGNLSMRENVNMSIN